MLCEWGWGVGEGMVVGDSDEIFSESTPLASLVFFFLLPLSLSLSLSSLNSVA